MKLFAILFLSAYLQIACSETNQYGSVKSDKLFITAKTYDNNPKNWLKYYYVNIPEGTENEKRISITAHFKLNKVSHIILTDINASNKLCGKDRETDILYLALNPDKNIQAITTRIHLPCMDSYKANIKLVVKTNEGKRFDNSTTLTAHPDAFNTVYKDELN